MSEFATWRRGMVDEPVVIQFNDCCVDMKRKLPWAVFCPRCGTYIEYMTPHKQNPVPRETEEDSCIEE